MAWMTRSSHRGPACFFMMTASLFIGSVCQPSWAGTISFPDFSDPSPLTLNGAASTVFFNGKDVLRLTRTQGFGGSFGSAFLTSAVLLPSNGSFDTFFEFQISNPSGISDADGPGADGIWFVLQPKGPTAFDLIPSLAIEFDTFFNPSSDPNGNHVGINLNGNLTSVATATVPTRLNDGAIWYAWVEYDGSTDQLEVRLSNSTTRPAAALLSYSLDLIATLGTSTVFAGFFSVNGGAHGDHDIRSWTFNSPTTVIPEPSSFVLLGLGMLGLGVYVRRRKRTAHE